MGLHLNCCVDMGEGGVVKSQVNELEKRGEKKMVCL